ncbi:fatty acid desaturase [Aliiruegeria haliotis]|uniref:Fatty acid desaturase n=1 Tax=Aliiruegeria haliotis TaxID=1280846 RepID=A0A2T0RKR6_9RHOB|nr:fatty acid desaturase [Aliiruegeria haliotis]PRY21785.1 fatty acid desaturase [Aliiruegeria haliotis]
MARHIPAIEWPTLALAFACYLAWGIGITWMSVFWLPAGIALTALAGALHSSLQHEMIHGHPFRNPRLNELLVAPALTLLIPYQRFRDTHLAHHSDETLTDPYDDPESNYMDPAVWGRLPAVMQAILRFNNTLFGRLIVGPLVAQVCFMSSDWMAIRNGDRAVAVAWLWHVPAVVLVLWLVALSPMPLWAYAIAAYASLSILKIRTFLEHQAHADSAGRTVIIEDRGLLAFLFLNNNLHVVHHMHPGVPWYALPKLFRERRDAFLARNFGYRYASYAEVFSRHFVTAKDPVPHPLRPTPLDVSAQAGSLTDTRKERLNAPASDHGNRGLHA